MLYSRIGSPTVVANFAALAQHIANKDLPHGADIIVSMHARLLKALGPFSLKPGGSVSQCSSVLPKLVEPAVGASDVLSANAKPNVGPSNKQSTRSESLPSGPGNCESASNVSPHPSGGMVVPHRTKVVAFMRAVSTFIISKQTRNSHHLDSETNQTGHRTGTSSSRIIFSIVV